MHESDVFIDSYEPSVNYLYDSEPIPESLLPPVYYAKRGDKRIKLDSTSTSTSTSPAKKQNNQILLTTPLPPSELTIPTSTSLALGSTSIIAGATVAATATATALVSAVSTSTGLTAKASVKMENIIIPRLLFDKTNTALVKLRRDIKMQKLKGWPTFKLDVIKSTLPIQPEFNLGKDDWLPNDDYVILHTLQVILELPLNLQQIAPAHQPNWDLISDLVSSNSSKQYRSPLDCKKRFENVILKREELCLSEIQNKKQQLAQQQQQQAEQQGGNKTKQSNKPAPLNICKTKTLRTNQLYIQDNYKTVIQNQKRRFEKINFISKKKHPSQFSLFTSASLTNQNQSMFNLQQQQAQFDLLLTRFNPNQSSQITYNSTGNYSTTVSNAINAVTTACKQSAGSTNTETISFKTPKFLSDLKNLKERKSKIEAANAASAASTTSISTLTPSTPSTTNQASPAVPITTSPANSQQQQQQNIIHHLQQQQQQQQQPKAQNQTIMSHLQQQQQQKATSAIAAQLAAAAAAVAAATEARAQTTPKQQAAPLTTVHNQTQPQSIQLASSAQIQALQQQIQANLKQNQQRSVSTEILNQQLNQSNLRSLVQTGQSSTTTTTTTTGSSNQITSSGQATSGPQTISSIINNQQQQGQSQHQPQQAIRFYSASTAASSQATSGKNIGQSSLNEMRKKTTVAGITALSQASNASASNQQINALIQSQQQPQSPSQATITAQQQQHANTQHTLKQIIQQQKRASESLNKQIQLQQQQQSQQSQQNQQQNVSSITITTPAPGVQSSSSQQQQKMIPTLSMPIQLPTNAQTVLSRQASSQASSQQQINKPSATSILIRQHPSIQQLTATTGANQTAKSTKPVEQQTCSATAATTSGTTTTTITKINAPNQNMSASSGQQQVITVTPSMSSTQIGSTGSSGSGVQHQQQQGNGSNTTFTTLIKPINSVTLSLANQQKQGIITTNQPQQFRQFQLMTTTSGTGSNTSNLQSVSGQPPTQVLIQQQQGGGQQQTIRKVGSSTNLSTLQQKVQVLNRTGIQIVQTGATQRLTTKATPTTITTSQLPNVTGSGNSTTGGSLTNTTTSTPVQFQQVFQQQAAKLQQNQQQSTTINIQSLGSGLNTMQSASSLSSLMTGPNSSAQTKSTSSGSNPTTVKSLLAGANPTPIISITTNSTGIQQAVPININSSLSQVLRQFSAVNSPNIQTISSGGLTTAPTSITLIQAAQLTGNSDAQVSSNETINVQSIEGSNKNVNNESSVVLVSGDAQISDNK